MRTSRPVIVPAIMADEWESLVRQIESVSEVATQVQIDVMDGVLVPSFSFPYNQSILEGQQLPHSDSIIFEAHLMVRHPQEVGLRFIDAGVQRIVAQIEGFREGEAVRVCTSWNKAGAETGVSLMLQTSLDSVYELIDTGSVSFVQIMSIARVGFQGEEFDERAIVRVRSLRERYPDVTIGVDGGVGEGVLGVLLDAGATRFGVGSEVMHAQKPSAALAHMQEYLDKYAQ